MRNAKTDRESDTRNRKEASQDALSDLEKVHRAREAETPSIIDNDNRSRRDYRDCALGSLLEPSCSGMLELKVHNNPTLESLRC